jgi:AraC-like DNA-binding protein
VVVAETFDDSRGTDITAPHAAKFDGSRTDFTPYGFTCERWTPTLMPKADRHNEVEINYLPAGTLTYLIGGRVAIVEPRRFVLFWGAMPHQILEWEVTTPYYVATLPLAWFLSCDFPEHLSRPLLAGQIIVDPAPTARDEARLRQWVRDFHAAQALRERIAQLEVQARLLRMALAMRSRRAGPHTTENSRVPEPALSRADQIASFIARHYSEPLTAERIARAVGVHPNYAMGLVRKAFGTTMTALLLQHRISHAQRQLITTRDPVIEIAAAAGFQSLSRFNEAFRKACGCSPRDYRRAHSRLT